MLFGPWGRFMSCQLFSIKPHTMRLLSQEVTAIFSALKVEFSGIAGAGGGYGRQCAAVCCVLQLQLVGGRMVLVVFLTQLI